MSIKVRIRDGMCPDPTTGEGGATEGDIRGSFSDIIGTLGVKDLSGGHCLVTQNSPAAMSVLVAPGIVYIPNADFDELDSDEPKFYEVVIDDAETNELTIADNTSPQLRYDLVCVKVDKTILPDEHASNISTLVIVQGTPAGGVPATPSNHYKLAEVMVLNNATTILNWNITDRRVQSTFNSNYIRGDGWISANETWEYVSVDDPTGIFRVNADVTGKYSAGMRIKFTNGGNVIFGIITVVGAYTGGYTSITFLHQIDPTDSLALYLMANSAITLNYYSTQKIPFGFPIETSKWTVKYKAASSFSQSNPVKNQWYNTDSLSIPIGNWNVSWSGIISATSANQAVSIRISGTLSSANNSEDDIEFSIYQGLNAWTDASTSLTILASVSVCKNITLTSKTIKYFNIKTSTDSAIALVTVHTTQPIIIKAICAYL